MAIDPQTSKYTQLGGGIAANSPRIYEMSVDDISSSVIETVGYLDPIAQLDNPAVSRPFADGDFIQIKMTQSVPKNCLLYQVSYDSEADTYTLIRKSMGKTTSVGVEDTFDIVYAGLVSWSGGLSTHTFSTPGVVDTDVVIFTPSVLPSDYKTFKVAMVTETDGVTATLGAADTENVSKFFIFVVRSVA